MKKPFIKKLLLAWSILTPVFLMSCFDFLDKEDKNQKEQHDLMELDDIRSGVSIAVVDHDTRELIAGNITLLIHRSTAGHTVDLFSQSLDSIDFTGGFFNLGIANSNVPSPENQVAVFFTLKSTGYLDKKASIVLSDTGLAHFEVALFSKDNPPGSYSTTTITAPRDADGNPLALDNPLDPNDGGRIVRKQEVVQDGNAFVTPFIFPYPFGDNYAWFYEVTGPAFTGTPAAYSVSSYVWTTIPEEVSPYFPDANNSRGLPWTVEVFKTLDFQIKATDTSTFRTVKLVASTSEGVTNVTSMMICQVPDLSNANFWESKIGATAYFHYAQFVRLNYYLPLFIDDNETFFTGVNIFSWYPDQWPDYSVYAPAFYHVFLNQNDTSEGFQKFFISQYQVYERSTFASYPFNNQIIYAGLDVADISFQVDGYGRATEMDVEILSGGHTFKGSDLSDDHQNSTIKGVPISMAKITVKMPEGDYSTYWDLKNNPDNLPLLLSVPGRNEGLFNSKITVNLDCSSNGLHMTKIPNTSIRYRYYNEMDKTEPWQIATITSWNFDSSTNTLESITVEADAVGLNESFQMAMTVFGQTNLTYFVASDTILSVNMTVPDFLCSN